MSNERTFTAGETAAITGVGTNTQLDWRRRGFLPPSEGKWTRFTLRDVCRLRLMTAFTRAGLPVGSTVPLLADEFLDVMESSLRGEQSLPSYFAETLAVVARRGEMIQWTTEFNFDAIRMQFQMVDEKDDTRFNFDSLLIVNLAQEARAMAAEIAKIGVSPAA
jgi:hypothetical protein